MSEVKIKIDVDIDVQNEEWRHELSKIEDLAYQISKAVFV
jgi:hypothetical protein